MRFAVGVLLIWLSRANPSAAQVATPSDDGAVPPVEIGTGLGGIARFAILDGSARGDFTADGRLTIPLSPRFALEGLTTIARRDSYGQTRVEGLYGIVIRQRLGRASRPGFTPFATYGAGGEYSRVSAPERRYTRADGAVLVSPAFAHGSAAPPVLPMVGGGVQQQIGRHVALRLEGQAIFFVFLPYGARFSAGVSIPIGAYPR